MNTCNLLGRTTKDPDVRYTADTQMAVAKFTLAIDDGYGEKKRTNFIPVTVFGKGAEFCERYLTKGKRVAVEGKIQTGSYQNKEGQTVYTTDVIANRVHLVDWAEKDGDSGKQGANTGAPAGFSIADEDIPF